MYQYVSANKVEYIDCNKKIIRNRFSYKTKEKVGYL